jgi:hypothetical protein
VQFLKRPGRINIQQGRAKYFEEYIRYVNTTKYSSIFAFGIYFSEYIYIKEENDSSSENNNMLLSGLVLLLRLFYTIKVKNIKQGRF